jgi:hypothetical protein
MNKNRVKAILFSIAAVLFVGSSFLAPLASAIPVPESKYLEIPITVVRNKPTLIDATGDGCLAGACKDVQSGIGVYAYVGAHKVESSNISSLVAIDKSVQVNNVQDDSNVLTPDWEIVNGALRVYGLTVGHTYSMYFIYDDAQSTDIQNLVSKVGDYCNRSGLAEPPHPAADNNAVYIAYHIKLGCSRYNSEPWLPAAVNAYNVNGGADFKYDKAVKVLGTATIQATAPAVAGFGSTDGPSDDCPIDPAEVGRWLTCWAYKAGKTAAEGMDRAIQNFLFTPTQQIFTSQMHSAWASFRTVGVALILIAGLVMVISQALGMEIFDAYTVKKVLPRLLIAAIGITLSWPILQFVITFFNDLGGWAHDIILAPFSGLDAFYNNGAAGNTAGSLGIIITLLAAYAVVGSFALGGLGIIALLGTGMLGLLIGLLVLAIRQAVILMAVLMAPLAIAAYILPGTQKLWEFWKNALLTSLFMFPIIMGFIAAGKALAFLLGSVPDAGTLHLLAVLCYFAPYFLLPFAFKLAGGLMSTVFSIANDRGRGGFDRLRKFREGQSQKRMGYYGQRIGDRTLQARAEAVRKLNASASGRGRFAGGAMRFAGRQVAGLGGIEAKMSAINARTGKEINDEIATGRDDRIRGLTVDRSMGWDAAVNDKLAREENGRRQWKSLGGQWVDEADVIEGQRRWGNDVAAQQAALSYEMRKADTEEKTQELARRYGSLATNQWRQTDTQAGGSWIGAAFENQNQHLEYKSTNWKDGTLSAAFKGTDAAGREVVDSGLVGTGLVTEAYEKRGSYNLSQMGSNTIEQLKEAYKSADLVISGRDARGNVVNYTQEQKAQARDHQEKIEAIAETFMHEYSSGRQIGQEGDTPIPDSDIPGKTTRQASTQGAAHVGERVVDLAKMTGIYDRAPAGYYGPGHTPTPNPKEQK